MYILSFLDPFVVFAASCSSLPDPIQLTSGDAPDPRRGPLLLAVTAGVGRTAEGVDRNYAR
jgi:hypothetical protein